MSPNRVQPIIYFHTLEFLGKQLIGEEFYNVNGNVYCEQDYKVCLISLSIFILLTVWFPSAVNNMFLEKKMGHLQEPRLHLSPGAKVAHRASTYPLRRFLSCAVVCTPLHPALDLSFSTVCRQVVFGRPTSSRTLN